MEQNFWSLTFNEILTILALLISPFLAVFAQSRIEERNERMRQKLWVFRTLMATRANRLAPEHVQALNSIELLFIDKIKEKDILEKWNEYFDYFQRGSLKDETEAKIVLEKGDELLSQLLLNMGKSLGYDFDKVKIKRGIYRPVAHDKEFQDQENLKKGISELISGRTALKVYVENVSPISNLK